MAKPKPLRVWYLNDEPVEIRISPFVQIAAEEEFGQSLGKMDRLRPLYWMAWTQLTRSGKETRSFDEFTDAAIDIEPVEAPDSLDPTLEGQSRDSSSS